MSINDKIIARTEGFYADEFEKAQANRAGVVSYYWMNYATIALAPLLAWLLPGNLTYLSFLVMIPTFIGQIFGNSWLKKTVARPTIRNMNYLWGWEWAFIVAVMAAWLAGMIHAQGGGDTTSRASSVIGAMVGASIAWALIPLITSWQRKRDLKRLDSQAED